MSEMVERVAKAMAVVDNEGRFEYLLPYARAAIEAMREPTEAMMISAKESSTGGIAPGDEIRYDPNDVWSAMIDAALAPQLS